MSNLKMTNINSQHGAPMGRCDKVHDYHEKVGHLQPTGKIHMARVYLNQGGYDNGGAYWGIGGKLYMAWHAQNDFVRYVRACDRESAKAQVLETWPRVSFYI